MAYHQVYDLLKACAGRLWQELPSAPSGETALFYAGIVGGAAFMMFMLYYAIDPRNPPNIDTFIKNNKYVVITKQTVAAFCTTAVLTAAYYAIYKPATQGGDNIINQSVNKISEYDPAFKLTIFALFASFAYVLYQSYGMLKWSLTNASSDDYQSGSVGSSRSRSRSSFSAMRSSGRSVMRRR